MGEKVKVTKEQAEQINLGIDLYGGAANFLEAHASIGKWRSPNDVLNKITTWKMVQILVNGYEVERTPQEKALAYYKSFDNTPLGEASEKKVIRKFLQLAEIKFEGINE